MTASWVPEGLVVDGVGVGGRWAGAVESGGRSKGRVRSKGRATFSARRRARSVEDWSWLSAAKVARYPFSTAIWATADRPLQIPVLLASEVA